jgi:hypothetical protein
MNVISERCAAAPSQEGCPRAASLATRVISALWRPTARQGFREACSTPAVVFAPRKAPNVFA